MKKLLTLLFTLAIVFSLTMPVFAQEAGQEAAPKAEKKKKAPKEKKKKKAPKEETKASTPETK
jgi:hypothetical protein